MIGCGPNEEIRRIAAGLLRIISRHKTLGSYLNSEVAAGVDITVIRSWLGHVSLDTTNHYAQANLETKRKAPEPVGLQSNAGKLPRWRNRSILEWLDSL